MADEDFFPPEESERRMNILLRNVGKNPLTDEERATLADIRKRNGAKD